MEEHLGRYLSKKEAVHHKDEIKLHNVIENLQLCVSVGIHTRDHHLRHDAHGRFLGKVEQKPRRHGTRKLSDEAIIEIRRRRATGETLQSIANDFGIVFSTVDAICKKRLHKNV